MTHVTINGKIKITTQLEKIEKVGGDIVLSVNSEKIHVFDKRSGDAITDQV
jgi:hypothetical protein